MINKNKTSRVILALLMTLNINFIFPSSTNATPVEDNYYNPYSHGKDLDNNTYGANGESNSERQAREKKEAEAKKLAEQQAKAKANQQAQSNADKFAQFNAEHGGDVNDKDSFTKIDDGKNNDDKGTARIKYDDDFAFSDESMKKYNEKAKAECLGAVEEIIKSGKGVKIDGKITTNPDEICSAKTIEDLGTCFATFSMDKNSKAYVEPSEEIKKQCIDTDVLADKNIKDNGEGWFGLEGKFNSIRDSVANTLQEHGFPLVGEIVKSFTIEDVIAEAGMMALGAAITLATGGAGAVVLVARVASLANKAKKIKNIASGLNNAKSMLKAEKLKGALKATTQVPGKALKATTQIPVKVGSKIKNAISPTSYGRAEKEFIKEAEKISNGQKFKTLEEAQEFIKNTSRSSGSSFKDALKNPEEVLKAQKLEKLEKASKEFDKFKEKNFTELGRIGEEGKSINVARKEVNDGIEGMEKQIKNTNKEVGEEFLKNGESKAYTEKLEKFYAEKEQLAFQKETAKTLENDIKNLNISKDVDKALSGRSTLGTIKSGLKGSLALGVPTGLYQGVKHSAEVENQDKLANTKEPLIKELEVKTNIRDGYDARAQYIEDTKYADEFKEIENNRIKVNADRTKSLDDKLKAQKELNEQEASLRNNIANNDEEYKNARERVASLNKETTQLTNKLNNSTFMPTAENLQNNYDNINAQAKQNNADFSSMQNK